MSKSDGRSVADRVALFRQCAEQLANHPAASAVGQVRTQYSASGEIAGTQIDQVQLESLLTRARIFDERNDKAVALTTMTNVLRNDLVGHEERVQELDLLRRDQKDRRRKHLQMVGTGQNSILTIKDLADLASYGQLWHLDADKQKLNDALVNAGAGLLLHQALLLHVQILLPEVNELIRFIDRCESAGIAWSTT